MRRKWAHTRSFRRAIVIACLLLAWPALADAQSLLPPGKAQTAAEETAQSDVAAAIREAADKGVSVIVIWISVTCPSMTSAVCRDATRCCRIAITS